MSPVFSNALYYTECDDIGYAKDGYTHPYKRSLLPDGRELYYSDYNGQPEQNVLATMMDKTADTGVILFYSFTSIHLPIRRIIGAKVN